LFLIKSKIPGLIIISHIDNSIIKGLQLQNSEF